MMNFGHVAPLLAVVVLNAAVEVASSDNSRRQWDGGCHKRCLEDPEQFCQQDTKVCMDCSSTICNGEKYIDQCHAKCPAYLEMPTVENIWDGCTGSCQHDLDYYCESSVDTCMRCDGLCNSKTTYYKEERCFKNCAGYVQSIAVTTESLHTTTISPSQTSIGPPQSNSLPTTHSPVRRTTGIASATDASLPQTSNSGKVLITNEDGNDLPVIIIVSISSTLLVISVFGVLVILKVIPWVKRRRDRNRHFHIEEELGDVVDDPKQNCPEDRTERHRLVQQPEKDDIMHDDKDGAHEQPTLPFPFKETGEQSSGGSDESGPGLNVVGGTYSACGPLF